MDLARHCASVRNPVCAIRSAGLHRQPWYAEIENEFRVDRRQINRQLRREVINILYHLDEMTLFMPIDLPEGPRDPPPLPPGPPRPPAGPRDPPPSPPGPAPGGPDDDEPSDGPGPGGGSVSGPATIAGSAAPQGSTTGASSSSSSGAPKMLLGPQGLVHNAMWCKYALAVLLQAHEESDIQDDVVFSLGPKLTKPISFFTLPIDNGAELSTEFEFSKPPGAENDTAHQGCDLGGGSDEGSDVLFFRIVDERPAGRELAPGAYKADRGALAVEPLAPLRVDTAASTVIIKLEEGGDGDTHSFDLLTTANLTVDDFDTVRMWKSGPLVL